MNLKRVNDKNRDGSLLLLTFLMSHTGLES